MRAPIPRNRLDIFCRLDRGAIFIPAAYRGRNTKRGACSRTTKHHAERKKHAAALDTAAKKLQG
jgi:hypothetical protein